MAWSFRVVIGYFYPIGSGLSFEFYFPQQKLIREKTSAAFNKQRIQKVLSTLKQERWVFEKNKHQPAE